MQTRATPTSTAATPDRSIADVLSLLDRLLSPQRRMLHAGDVLYQAGQRFGDLYILNSQSGASLAAATANLGQ